MEIFHNLPAQTNVLYHRYLLYHYYVIHIELHVELTQTFAVLRVGQISTILF